MVKKLIVLSGLSGSGNTTLIKELIDLNYFVLMSLKTHNYYEILNNILNNSENDKIAIFLNIENNYEEIYKDVLNLKNDPMIEYIQVFLKADDNVLINRYQENRKTHPLNKENNLSIEQCINIEKKLTKNYAQESDYTIDTSSLFEKQLIKIFKSYISENSNFTINLFSFGFKYGLYQYSDFVFDTRFLKNPYYEEKLRMLSGEDEEVRDYVFSDQAAVDFLEDIIHIINLVVPKYEEVDKKSVSISIGCTGGKHRSASFVEELEKKIKDKYEVNKFHIEKEKGNWR